MMRVAGTANNADALHVHPHDCNDSASRNQRRLLIALALAATYMVAEFIGGLLTGSLALLADAGHMLSDVFALAMSAAAIRIARLPPTPQRTYGYQRTEIVAALGHGVLLVCVSVYIFITAFQRISAPVEILEVSGEDIPADDNCYDSVVCTWTLCSIPNVYAALREIRRVLKPGGSFYFIEHGRAPDPKIIRWQHRLEPLWKKIGGGCHLSRRADELICDAGFGLTTCATGYEPGPKFAAFMIHGIARKI